MKKWLYMLPVALILFACGNDEEVVEEEPLVLESASDRLGYVLGALNAQSIMSSGSRSAELNKEKLIEGFNMNLNNKDCSECDEILIKFLGPYYQDFDTTYLDKGSECIGRQSGSGFYRDMTRMGGLKGVNLEMVKAGFKHGIYKTDTLIEEGERRQMVGDFIMDLNVTAGNKMLEKAAKIPGVQVFDNGVVMATLEEGKGGSPTALDDVQVEYILTNAYGDTIQSSFVLKQMQNLTEPLSFNLTGVYPGWTFALPKMKKGGKYRLYLPWQLGQGEQGGKESLCFYIELLNFGPAGSYVKPELPMGSPQ